MAFDLSSLFGRYNSSSVQNNTAAAGIGNMNGSAQAVKMMTLLPGQMVQGEVVSQQGNQVQLMLGNEILLNASLENQIGINPGQLMSFQVKSISSSQVSLVPLSINLTMDENMMKALNESGLPVTDKTVEMVNTLMKEGMPIDRETLLNVNKELMNFPEADVETIVQLERLKIPVTEANLEQFEAYKNYNHKLSEGVAELSSRLNALFQTAGRGAAEGLEGSQEFLRQMLDYFAGTEETAVLTEDGAVVKMTVGGEAAAVTEETAGMAGTEGAGQAAESAQSGKEVLPQAGAEALQEEIAKDEQTGKSAAGGTVSADSEVLNPSEKNTFLALLREIGTNPETVLSFQNGQINTKQLAAVLQAQNPDGEQLEKLFSSKEFGKLLQNEVADRLLLRPEQVSKEEIEEYYTNLKNQTTKLMQILESSGRGESPAAKTLQNMNRNVDFLNQLNQMFSYVQIPLKMAKETAHGDLYVYTNKKNLAGRDGNVSALLHLDMPHLGMVDVYVAMQQGKVSTQFYLQDESVIDFLEPHMELLTKRLEDKGYQASAKAVLREKAAENPVMEAILKQDKNVPDMMKIGMRSFDVRA